MIIVTGGAGFIGANIIARLNEDGYDDVVVVDGLGGGEKVQNVSRLRVADFISKEDFIRRIKSNQSFGQVEGILHQGACSDTMVTDGEYVMKNNFEFSKEIYEYCSRRNLRMVYASSASVYGNGVVFGEAIENEHPLNLYACSKFLFDQYVRKRQLTEQASVVGLRYFNVYGPMESHKGRMASVVWHFSRQLKSTGCVNLFEGSGGYAPGEQRRDFVSVDDVVDVNLHYLFNNMTNGIYNVGTGNSRSFNDMAKAVINAWRKHTKSDQGTAESLINYVPFPEALEGKYQSFTEADIGRLRASGYEKPMRELDIGVERYVDWLAREI